MIVTFELDLENENDAERYEHLTKAEDYYCVIFDMYTELRKKIKYEDKTELQEAYDLLFDVMKDHHVTIV